MRLKLFLIACLAGAALAQKIATPATAISQKVDKIFAAYNHQDTPGCAVGATLHDATVLSAAYGMADLEHDIPLTPSSVFEAGSVSKQFTAAAILLLVKQGKISLDDPVSKYIPEIPDYGKPLTIRHLLNHTSGLRDWGSVEGIAGWPRTTRAYTHAHVLEIVSRQKNLNYPPGDAYSYSNTGYNLAAMLVARVSGKSFAEFSRDSIFNPLDMSATQWRDDYQRIVKNHAIAYSGSGNKVKILMPFEDVHGNGGLLTTVGDLLRWNRNFAAGKVGGKDFAAIEETQGRLTDGRTIGYAAGLMIFDYKGLREVSHSGATAGYRAWLGRYPDQGLSVAVLCNVTSANATALGHAVADVFLGGAVRPVASKTAAQAEDAVALGRLAGLYRSVRDHEALAVGLKDGHLEIDKRGALKPVSSNVFTQRGDDGPRVEFDVDGSGTVKGLRIWAEIDGGSYYERVEAASPSSDDLQAMTGTYVSDEAETELRVTLEEGKLSIHRRPNASFVLTPTYRDGFSSPIGSIRFLRDASGGIVELSIGESRVWDIRFKRVK